MLAFGGFAAGRYGFPAIVVVPHGNSTEKNAAMHALGVGLIEFGEDFHEAREHAEMLARERGLSDERIWRWCLETCGRDTPG